MTAPRLSRQGPRGRRLLVRGSATARQSVAPAGVHRAVRHRVPGAARRTPVGGAGRVAAGGAPRRVSDHAVPRPRRPLRATHAGFPRARPAARSTRRRGRKSSRPSSGCCSRQAPSDGRTQSRGRMEYIPSPDCASNGAQVRPRRANRHDRWTRVVSARRGGLAVAEHPRTGRTYAPRAGRGMWPACTPASPQASRSTPRPSTSIRADR